MLSNSLKKDNTCIVHLKWMHIEFKHDMNLKHVNVFLFFNVNNVEAKLAITTSPSSYKMLMLYIEGQLK